MRSCECMQACNHQMTEESSLHSASLTADFPCFNRFPETSGISRNLPVLGSQGIYIYAHIYIYIYIHPRTQISIAEMLLALDQSTTRGSRPQISGPAISSSRFGRFRFFDSYAKNRYQPLQTHLLAAMAMAAAAFVRASRFTTSVSQESFLILLQPCRSKTSPASGLTSGPQPCPKCTPSCMVGKRPVSMCARSEMLKLSFTSATNLSSCRTRCKQPHVEPSRSRKPARRPTWNAATVVANRVSYARVRLEGKASHLPFDSPNMAPQILQPACGNKHVLFECSPAVKVLKPLKCPSVYKTAYNRTLKTVKCIQACNIVSSSA